MLLMLCSTISAVNPMFPPAGCRWSSADCDVTRIPCARTHVQFLEIAALRKHAKQRHPAFVMEDVEVMWTATKRQKPPLRMPAAGGVKGSGSRNNATHTPSKVQGDGAGQKNAKRSGVTASMQASASARTTGKGSTVALYKEVRYVVFFLCPTLADVLVLLGVPCGVIIDILIRTVVSTFCS